MKWPINSWRGSIRFNRAHKWPIDGIFLLHRYHLKQIASDSTLYFPINFQHRRITKKFLVVSANKNKKLKILNLTTNISIFLLSLLFLFSVRYKKARKSKFHC